MSIALVQYTIFTGNSNTSFTATLTGVGSGNNLIFSFNAQSAPAPSSITDSAGGTVLTALAWGGVSGYNTAIYYIENATAGTHTITVNFAATAFGYSGDLAEFSGLATSGSFDAAASQASGTGTAITANSVTPSIAGELAFASLLNTNAVAVTWTAPLVAVEPRGGAYAVLSGASPFTGAASYGSNNGWTIGVALFKPLAPYPIVNSSGLQAFSNTAGPVDYTTTWSVRTGNTLVVAYSNVDGNHNGNGIASVADGQGSYVSDSAYNGATHFQQGTFSLRNTTAGAHAIALTMNASAAAYGSFVVIELAGIWTYDALLGSQTGGPSPTPTVTGTAPAADDFQISIYCGTTSNNEPPSIPSGWSGSYMGIPASGWPSAAYIWEQSASAAGTISLGTLATSDTWGLIIAGYSPPAVGLSLVASGATFALTGNAATLTVGTLPGLTLLANPGSFDYQGAQSQSNLQIYANNASFTLTGENALFQHGLGAFTLTGAFGSFVLTGEPVVLQPGTYTLSAFTGIFTETGFAATLTQGTPTGLEYLPNFVGMDWLDASRVLYQGGYTEIDPQIVKLKGPSAATKRGIVVGQTPVANTLVKSGASVQLSVASDHMLAVSFEAI